VARVYPKGPGAEAGLQPGDVIISVDGYDVPDGRAALYRLTTHGVGKTAKLDILRKGRRMVVTVALRAAPELGKDDVRNLSGTHPFEGARVANIIPGAGDAMGLSQDDGVVVLSVRPGSTAARIGFRTGDIIVQVGGAKIDTVNELEAQLKERRRIWQLVLKRGEQIMQLQLPG
jgi:S1-C subfamily serine protease